MQLLFGVPCESALSMASVVMTVAVNLLLCVTLIALAVVTVIGLRLVLFS